MKIDLVQNTPEWLKYRSQGIGASEAAALLHECPYMTPHGLYLEKKGLSTRDMDNVATRHGHEYEDVARRKYIDETGLLVKPTMFKSDEREFMFASLDGYNPDYAGGLVTEIKCPFGDNAIEKAKAGEIPKNYLIQMNHQMYCSGAKKAHYYCYDAKNDEGYLIPVERDLDLIKDIVNACENFWLDHVAENDPPPLTDRDYAVDESNDMRVLFDEYKTLDAQMKARKLQLQAVKEKIVDRMSHVKVSCGSDKVYQVIRKGNVNYKKAIEDLDLEIDEEKYRGKPSRSFTIRIGDNKDG